MRTEVLVIGAGGAGLTAAVVAAENGCRVVLVDSGSVLGGQYFRHNPKSRKRPDGWKKFAALQRRAQHQQSVGALTHLSRTMVWSVSHDGEGFIARATKGERDKSPIEIRTKRLVIATGAHDRAIPYAGWTSAGNYTIGAVQAMIKGNDVLVGKNIVLAGTGPFLLAAAESVIAAGGTLAAVVEANSVSAMAKYPRALVVGRNKIPDALRYLWQLRKHRVPILKNSRVISANSLNGELKSVTILGPSGKQEIACDAVGTGFGFSINLEVASSLGLATTTTADNNVAVAVDEMQSTSHPYVFAAGETTGIAGIDAALVEGEIAGAGVVASLGLPSPNVSRALKQRRQLHEFAAYLAKAYPVDSQWVSEVADDVIVCRCEEVTAGALRNSVENLGAANIRSAKLFTRAGMGWCQGRQCARTCSELIGQQTGIDTVARDIEGAARKSIINPVPLGTVAHWSDEHR